MRIHTNKFRASEVRDALIAEQQAGRIARSVDFKVLHECGSRSHEFAIEVQLESFGRVEGDGRRSGNSGSYGAGENYAATYDEWGWLLAALYTLDPEMVVGAVKTPIYRDREHFDFRTALTYNPTELLAYLSDDGYDPYPYIAGKAQGTKKGYIVGRRGAGRLHYDHPRASTYAEYRERTADEVREFARVDAS